MAAWICPLKSTGSTSTFTLGNLYVSVFAGNWAPEYLFFPFPYHLFLCVSFKETLPTVRVSKYSLESLGSLKKDYRHVPPCPAGFLSMAYSFLVASVFKLTGYFIL